MDERKFTEGLLKALYLQNRFLRDWRPEEFATQQVDVTFRVADVPLKSDFMNDPNGEVRLILLGERKGSWELQFGQEGAPVSIRQDVDRYVIVRWADRESKDDLSQRPWIVYTLYELADDQVLAQTV